MIIYLDLNIKLLSINIAAFNAATFVLEAVDSVLIQNLPDGYRMEVLIGVDGCTSTWKRVQQIMDPRVRCFLMERNYGTYITFNTLVSLSKGEFIARFDADDLMLPGFVQKQLELFERDRQVLFTRTWSKYIDEYKQPIRVRLGDGSYTAADGIRKRPSHGIFMMRRTLLDKLGGFKPWPCSGDSEFLSRLDYLGLKKGVVEEPLFLRRVHPNSLTQNKRTGLNSTFRKKYEAIMHKENQERRGPEDCYVKPELGRVLTD